VPEYGQVVPADYPAKNYIPTRGERNNNPGNLNYIEPPHQFQGQIGIEYGVPNPRFGRYDTVQNGIRALARQLILYEVRHNWDTPRRIASAWAPARDSNNTENYIIGFAAALGVAPDQTVSMLVLGELSKAVNFIIFQENGRNIYDPAIVSTACQSALDAGGSD
jgi:hypothetical protein